MEVIEGHVIPLPRVIYLTFRDFFNITDTERLGLVGVVLNWCTNLTQTIQNKD